MSTARKNPPRNGGRATFAANQRSDSEDFNTESSFSREGEISNSGEIQDSNEDESQNDKSNDDRRNIGMNLVGARMTHNKTNSVGTVNNFAFNNGVADLSKVDISRIKDNKKIDEESEMSSFTSGLHKAGGTTGQAIGLSKGGTTSV